MDHQTRHEIWVIAAIGLAPVPLFTAIAVITTLQ
jgi:hypothetical protein